MAQTKDRQQRRRGGPSAGPIRKKNCWFCRNKIEEVDYKDVNQLRRYVSEKGKIRSRRITGACRRHQRQVAVAVKRARGMALLPRKLAEPAAPGRVAELEKLTAARARHEAQSFEQAQALAQKLEGAEIRFDVNAGETGTLFGSVTATDIADRVWETQRVRIDRRKLDLPESIKRIGRYEVPIELFQDVTATLR